MSIKVQCPQCRLVAAAPDGQAGRYVRCKRCNAKFQLPQGIPTLPVGPSVVGRVPLPPESPTVIDRYEVRELLGSGSFGSVYRAFDPRLGREIALKVLRTEMTASPQAVERFLREAKAAAKLDHPHIVAVFDAGRAGDVYFIASAFIKGGTLASAIPEAGMEPRRAAELAAQLASALGYAHRQGVVHRDVKPANILVDEHGSLRLMDFGLAGWTREECTRLTQQGAIMGTPAYMAPEQAVGDTAQIGPASDQYSAGVVLYELLTGCRPFGGDNAASLMYQIVHTPASPPSVRRPGLDAGLDAICLRAMAKKPAERFDSGDAMAAALRVWAPTAILMAAPLAAAAPTASPSLRPSETPTVIPGQPGTGQPPAGLPTSVWEWVTETVGAPSAPTIQPAPAPSTIRSKRNRLNTVIPDRYSPKLKVWAYASGAALAFLLVATTLLYVLRSSTGAVSSSLANDKLREEFINSIGMRLKLIKPNSFPMGSPLGEPGAFEDEHPQHTVEITRPFYLGVYPVTQAEYVQATGLANPSWFSKEGGGNSLVQGMDTSKFPVEQVSWDDAAAFCEALNRQDAKKPARWKYALPTEAEWEYACRAGSQTSYFFGKPEKASSYAWHSGNSGARTHDVGTRTANPWGLFDMSGNVYQWCADGYEKDYYANCPQKDPQCGNAAASRVLRGGSWSDSVGSCRATYRNGDAPTTRVNDCGLRVCCRPAD
jgi:formylglycine-generating enzyme required for sulfatase activity